MKKALDYVSDYQLKSACKDPILPVMGAAPTLRQQSHMVADRSERLANVTPCADCVRPRQLLKLGLKCEMACGRCGGEGIINPSNLS